MPQIRKETTLNGSIEHIRYRNEANGYTVLDIRSGNRLCTVVGLFEPLSEGQTLSVNGRFERHASYGEQFRAESYSAEDPKEADGIERYLASGAVKGIGKMLAKRIVDLFGDDSLRILEEEPERLSEVKGISERKAMEIASRSGEQRSLRRAILFLQSLGISYSLGVRVYEAYGDEVYSILRENPYRLAEEIRGVGFLTADRIAERAGIRKDSGYRLKSALLYVLSQAGGEGNVYLPEEQLIAATAALTGTEEEGLRHALTELQIDRRVVVRNTFGGDDPETGMPERIRAVYPGTAFSVELNIARMLTDLAVSFGEDGQRVREDVEAVCGDGGYALEPEQAEAVCMAAENGVFIMTGGPCTGKTTTINGMIRYFEAAGLQVVLAAPTGRAAKRMTEATGREASTIHRLLEISALPEDSEDEFRFERNEMNPLEADVVIIDEMSMVDMYILHALLRAVPRGARLVLVGDADQLPSVGPGAVLRDLIRSEAFPCVRLTRIFRQEEASDIILNAHRINAGEEIRLDNRSTDFFFLERSDTERILYNTIELVRDKLPGYVDTDPFHIQVLTPVRNGPLGVARLNAVLQESINPPAPGKDEHVSGDRIFRTGDKVMQIRNNYQAVWEIRGRGGITVEEGSGVFNGDMGVIRRILSFTRTLTVEFDDGKTVEYPFDSLEELELAYAVTIHKAQGSEFPAVVLPLLNVPPMLATRNLLYTAVTRAMRCVTILGSRETVFSMISRGSGRERYTSLDERIREICGLHPQ